MAAFGQAYDSGERTEKDKGKTIVGQEKDEEEENLGNLILARLPSQVMEEDEDELETDLPLPRTKSQLTMLLERDRLSSGKDKGKGKSSVSGKGTR